MIRRTTIVLALLSSLLIPTVALHADDADEVKILPLKSRAIDGDGWLGISFEDAIDSYLPSRLTKWTNRQPLGVYSDIVICKSTQDANCQDEKWTWDGISTLPECKNAEDLNCVESLSAKLKDGTVINGSVASRWNEVSKFSEDKSKGIPAGGEQLVWKIPGANVGGSDEFALIPSLRFQGQSNAIRFDSLNVILRPVTPVTGNYGRGESSINSRGTGKGLFTNTMSNDRGCVISDTNRCALATSFKDLSTEFTVKIRLSQEVQPWLHGRMFEPSIETKSLGGTANLISVTAKPLEIPLVAGWLKWSDVPDKIKARYPFGAGGTAGDWIDWIDPDISKRILRVMQPPAGDSAILEFKDWNPLFSDKSYTMKTMWSVRTIQYMNAKVGACSTRGFSGLVTTNAAVYSDGPPSYNASDGSMDYVVGAPHYTTKGDVFKGNYGLIMRSDVARCIYGFGTAPISAKIEIASENGTPSVAVTTISQNADWLRLFAAGFTYSTPQIKVKLTEDKPAPVVAPTPQASASPAPVAAKPVAKKITCTKGKIKKTVTGTKCPAGFKKAA